MSGFSSKADINPFEYCVFTDNKTAQRFVKRHEISSLDRCIEILMKTRKNLDPVKEAFLIGLNGFPNKLKGHLQDGNIVAFNWAIQEINHKGITSQDPKAVSDIVNNVCNRLRIKGDTKPLIFSLIKVLETNEKEFMELRNEVEEMAGKGVSIINAGNYFNLRKSLRKNFNSSMNSRGHAAYTVRKYNTKKALCDYLEEMPNSRKIYVCENGFLNEEELKNLQFMEALRYLIRSEFFQNRKYPTDPPFFVYEKRANTRNHLD